MQALSLTERFSIWFTVLPVPYCLTMPYRKLSMNKQRITYMTDFIWENCEWRQGQCCMVMAGIINWIIPLGTVIPITRLHF